MTSLWNSLVAGGKGYANIKRLQLGADSLINSNTAVNIFALNGQTRKALDDMIHEYFVRDIDGTFNENEAALLKLTALHIAAKQSALQNDMELIHSAAARIWHLSEGKIGASTKLDVLSQFGPL